MGNRNKLRNIMATVAVTSLGLACSILIVDKTAIRTDGEEVYDVVVTEQKSSIINEPMQTLFNNTMQDFIERVNKITEPKEYKTGYVTEAIKVRKEPTIESDVYEVLYLNDKVEYTEIENNNDFLEIKYNDTIAYVTNDYISDKEVEIEIPTITEVEEEETQAIEKEEEVIVTKTYSTNKLTARKGVNYYNGVKETYYNLPMKTVIYYMNERGFYDEYWVREDGCKMFGDYIMVATDTTQLPYGTIVETSLGLGMIVDHCESAERAGIEWLDLACDWG